MQPLTTCETGNLDLIPDPDQPKPDPKPDSSDTDHAHQAWPGGYLGNLRPQPQATQEPGVRVVRPFSGLPPITRVHPLDSY